MLVLGVFGAIAVTASADGARAAGPAVAAGAPVPWAELSGLAGDPNDPDRIWAAGHDSLAGAVVYALDTSTGPATMVGRIVVSDRDGVPRDDLDLQGIALVGRRGAWVIADARRSTPARLIRIDARGIVIDEVALPDGGGPPGTRPTAVAVDDDGETEVVYLGFGQYGPGAPTMSRIGRWDTAQRKWSFLGYATDASPQHTGGIEDFAPVGDGTFLALERSLERIDDPGRVYRIDLRFAEFVPIDLLAGAAPVAKDLVVDLQPALGAARPWTPAPVTGIAVTADGRVHVATVGGQWGAHGAGPTHAVPPPHQTVVLDLDLETLLISSGDISPGDISSGEAVSARADRGASRRRS